MTSRADLVQLLRRACDALRDELEWSESDEDAIAADHAGTHQQALREHRELADELDRFLAGEARRIANQKHRRRGLRPKGEP